MSNKQQNRENRPGVNLHPKPDKIEFTDEAGELFISPENTEIFQAINKFQAELNQPKKGKDAKIVTQKGTYHRKYSDMAEVWESIQEPLASNELALIQFPSTHTEWEANPNHIPDIHGPMAPKAEGYQPAAFKATHVAVITVLSHKTGQWLKNSLSHTIYGAGIQDVGSIITYLRRYAAMALLGISPAEDDGKAAQDKSLPTVESDGVVSEQTQSKHIRAAYNKKLQACKKSDQYNKVAAEFRKLHMDKLEKATHSKKGETFKDLFSEHLQRISLAEQQATKGSFVETWAHKVKHCENPDEFLELEEEYKMNPDWVSKENDAIINKTGKELGISNYI